MNIIPKDFKGKVDGRLAAHAVEKDLLDAVSKVSSEAADLLEKGEYPRVLNTLAKLKMSVDAFFDGVLVMDKDTDVKSNRLAILRTVSDLFARVADFRKVVTE